MIKRFAFSCICMFVFLFTKAQTIPAPAEMIMEQAYKTATKESKNIILIFHASWCGWCHKMDKSMEDPDCKKLFSDNYITVHMTVDESEDKKNLETPGADEFRKKYSGDNQGLPYWMVFDKDGNLLADSKMKKEGEGADTGQNVGCPASKEEVAHFIRVLKKTSDLKEDELEIIEKRFRKNEQ
ncbi:MAG: thioredoxin family protein [Chitinophagaceae bacterium]|nr:thioredoxin family protein [Chitinophagaceae bacterium]